MKDLRNFAQLAFVAAGICLLHGLISSAEEPRQWTSSDNAFKVSATFVSATETEVRLRRADNGKEIVVPITKLGAADKLYIKKRLEDKQPKASEKAKPANAEDTKLRIEKTEGNQLVLHPYGVLPIPELVFQWSIVGENPPKIQAVHSAPDEGTGKPKLNDRVVVEIHPYIAADQRADFITKRNDQLAKEMRRDAKDFVNSSIDGGVRNVSNEYQLRLNQFTSNMDACGQYVFWKTKL